MLGLAGMGNVHACERLLPVVGQFAAEHIHQQPVREVAVAPTSVLPEQNAAWYEAARAVPALLLPGCVLAPGPTALAECRPRGPGSILSANLRESNHG